MGKREDVMRVRGVSEECLRMWLNGDSTGNLMNIHNECQLVWIHNETAQRIQPNNMAIDWSKLSGCSDMESSYHFPIESYPFMIKNVSILETAAAVRVTIKVGDRDVAGWMVFLNANENWKCISFYFSFGNSDNGEGESYVEFRKLRELTWGILENVDDDDDELNTDNPNEQMSDSLRVGYRIANRTCNGIEMERVLHPEAFRLSEANRDNGTISVLEREIFCNDIVPNRYNNPESIHYQEKIKYSVNTEMENKFEQLAASYDEIIFGEFATPVVAMVKCKIGHPPALWTDFLTCAKLGEQWWIMDKVSCRQDFPESNDL